MTGQPVTARELLDDLLAQRTARAEAGAALIAAILMAVPPTDDPWDLLSPVTRAVADYRAAVPANDPWGDFR